MSFFTVNKEEAAKVATGGNYISKSGVYDVTLKAVIVDKTKNGATTLNLWVDNNGQEQVLYSALSLTNNDGSDSFQKPLFSKLLTVLGLDSVNQPESVELPIGKDKTMKEVAVLTDIEDLDCKLWIGLEYSTYEGSIKEKKILKGVYASNGASADEIINETEIGIRFEKDSKYHENTTYKNDLTAEAVDAWIAAQRPTGTAGGSTSSTPAAKPSFGKPKFGAKQ